MRIDAVLNSNTTVLVATVQKANADTDNYLATVLVWGTFGAGSVALFLSPDKGVTLIPFTTAPGGTAVAFTAQGMVQFVAGHTARNTDNPLQIYATLSGATAPAVKISTFDNNG